MNELLDELGKVNFIVTQLTSPEVLTAQQYTYHYCVELASNKLDREGVRESCKVIDVVVLEPALAAIASIIAAAGWPDYSIMSYWVPQDSEEF